MASSIHPTSTRRRSNINAFGALLTEFLSCLLKTLWISLVAVVNLFAPVHKKNVRQEVVLVTGAGSGIGRLMALRFAELGATVRKEHSTPVGLNSKVNRGKSVTCRLQAFSPEDN